MVCLSSVVVIFDLREALRTAHILCPGFMYEVTLRTLHGYVFPRNGEQMIL